MAAVRSRVADLADNVGLRVREGQSSFEAGLHDGRLLLRLPDSSELAVPVQVRVLQGTRGVRSFDGGTDNQRDLYYDRCTDPQIPLGRVAVGILL